MLSAALGELLDAGAIGAIVIVNAVIGFLQEHRAERAVMALRSMTAPRARVMRQGHSVMIPADAIVPGDLLAAQGILLPPAFAAVLMSASTVIVAINAQLLRRASS